MIRVATIVGARPQFVKAATVTRAIAGKSGLEEVLIHTGQHYDENLSAVFFADMDIPAPQYQLGVGSGSHGVQTAHMLEAIEKVLIELNPDWVLLYGDTNSTLAGALAAAKMNIPLAHVEAGLRSFNRSMPEEINRIVADHVADLLFAPSKAAVENLKKEGIRWDAIHQVGDVMYDAALYYAKKAEENSRILETLSLRPKDYLLATIHRAENTDDPTRLKLVFSSLAEISKQLEVVLPLHPRTRQHLKQWEIPTEQLEKLRIIEPVGYLDMTQLEANAHLIATDSGGVQKEAYFHRVPCVTLREETEWVELLELGVNRLAPPLDGQAVHRALVEMMEWGDRGFGEALYGDGHAAERIVEILAGDNKT